MTMSIAVQFLYIYMTFDSLTECAFRCETCGLRFTQKEAAKRHLDVECGSKQKFSCDLCGHRFARKDDLHQHLKSVHKVKRSRLAKYGAGINNCIYLNL